MVSVRAVCPRLSQAKTLIGRIRCSMVQAFAARTVLAYYRRRWRCEEDARFAKTALGMERFCLRTYEAFGRLMLLLALAMSFLCWMALRQPTLTRWLMGRHPGLHQIKFPYYRLLEWLNSQIRSPAVRLLIT